MRERLSIIGTVFLLSASLSGVSVKAGTLMDAVKAGNISTVQKALQQHGDPNEAEPDGTTVLHWAAEKNRLDIVQALISAGAKADVKNRYGSTPLLLAATNGNAPIVELLLKSGADPNTWVSETGTALVAASRTGNAEVIKSLLKAGANANYIEPVSRQTALMFASAEGHEAAVRALLENGADPNMRAVSEATSMSADGVAYVKGGNTALFFAVRKGSIGSVEALLAAGADVNEKTPPEDAPSCDLCKKFPPGTKASPTGDSVLVVAILNANYEMADFLLSKGADPNAAGSRWAPLHALVRTRNYEETQYPAPIGAGHLDSLELSKHLLAHGADPNIRVKTMTLQRSPGDQNYVEFRGATPAFLASKAGDVPMMRVLLAAGADFSIPLENHNTPLMVAAGVGCVPGQWIEPERNVLEAVRILVDELKADVNAVNDRGETPLHGAACRGADSVVQYLVDKGAKLDVKDKDGQTAFDVASKGMIRPITIEGQPLIVLGNNEHTAILLKKLMAANQEHSASLK